MATALDLHSPAVTGLPSIQSSLHPKCLSKKKVLFLLLCPSMEMGVVSCILAAMSARVDLYSGAAWSAMPSVATRPISVVDVCCRHTLHVSWQPAVVPSASICLPLRKVCLLLLVDVLLSA